MGNTVRIAVADGRPVGSKTCFTKCSKPEHFGQGPEDSIASSCHRSPRGHVDSRVHGRE